MSISALARRAHAVLASLAGSPAPSSLDRRTLADIGIDPGPVLFVAHKVGADRLRPAAACQRRNTIAPWWTSSRHSTAR